MPSGTKCLGGVFGTACGLSSFVSPSAPSGCRRAHTSNPAKSGETTSANMNQLIPSRPRLLATTPTINANATHKGIIQNKKFPHSTPQEILRPEDQPLQVPYGASNSSAPWRMPFSRTAAPMFAAGALNFVIYRRISAGTREPIGLGTSRLGERRSIPLAAPAKQTPHNEATHKE